MNSLIENLALGLPPPMPGAESAHGRPAVAAAGGADEVWTPVGSMQQVGHTQAVVLQDGRTLVTAGTWFPASSYPKTAELYRPEERAWTLASSLPRALTGHFMATLNSGRVLVTGGVDSVQAGQHRATQDTAIYHPDANEWYAAGRLNVPRAGGRGTLLNDGRVFVVGGAPGADSRTAEIFDPVSLSWAQAPHMKIRRAGPAVSLLRDGQVLVVGGARASATGDATHPVELPEIFDPAANTWRRISDAWRPRLAFTATRMTDGRVLLAGGFVRDENYRYKLRAVPFVEIFDPATDSWTETTPNRTARFGHAAVLLPNGKVLIAGGFATPPPPSNGAWVREGSVEVYDPASQTWAFGPTLNSLRYNAMMVVQPSGRVLIAGGYDQGPTSVATAEEVDVSLLP